MDIVLSASDLARFWSKVAIKGPDDCWEWLKPNTRHGYGAFHVCGHNSRAHRVSYLIEHGAFDDTLNVLHKCDNPPCVNPGHLYLGTPLDNMRDKMIKGRGGASRGEDHSATHLKEQDILDIRASRESGLKLSSYYKISTCSVYNIKNRKTWTHII